MVFMDTPTPPNETVLSIVLTTLGSADLAIAQIRLTVFLKKWELTKCNNRPRQLSFFEAAELSNFAYKHAVQRTDTLAMLAIKHNVDMHVLKRVNNILSDHSLYSRSCVYIPVSSKIQVAGSAVQFEHCPLSCRDFIVVSGMPDGTASERDAKVDGGIGKAVWGAPQVVDAKAAQALAAKLSAMLGRSLRVDESTASFYLTQADGNIKEAVRQFEQDAAWEAATGPRVRRAPILKFIAGQGFCLPPGGVVVAGSSKE